MAARNLHEGYGDFPLPASWQERLVTARTDRDVLNVARDYLATFSMAEVATLPDPCKPTRLIEPEDVSSYAYALVRQQCEDALGVASPLHRLAVFFANASRRLAELSVRGVKYP